MKWILGGCAVIAVASWTFVYTAVRSILDEDWQPEFELSDRE